jgi:DNA-binding MarR family transcriptional regulator
MGKASAGGLDKDLGFNLHRVDLVYRRELTRCLRDYSMTPEQWQVLVGLWDRETLTQTEISEITQQDAPTISRMVKRMEANKLIQKSQNRDDKRQTLIRATGAGLKLKSSLPGEIRRHFAKVLKDFPKGKIDQLNKLLLEMRECLNDLPGEG